jgi:hypothetical protein
MARRISQESLKGEQVRALPGIGQSLAPPTGFDLTLRNIFQDFS